MSYTCGWVESLVVGDLEVMQPEQCNNGGIDALAMGLDRWLQRLSCCLSLYLGPGLCPDLGPLLAFCCFFVVQSFWPLISSSQLWVGLGDPGLHTLGALCGIMRQWAVSKWTPPPSGRMKRRVIGSSGWLHSEKTVLIGNL